MKVLIFFSSYVHNFRGIGGLGAIRNEVLYYISGKNIDWLVGLGTLMTLCTNPSGGEYQELGIYKPIYQNVRSSYTKGVMGQSYCIM